MQGHYLVSSDTKILTLSWGYEAVPVYASCLLLDQRMGEGEYSACYIWIALIARLWWVSEDWNSPLQWFLTLQ